MLPTLYTKSDSSAELSNFNLSKYACLDFMLFTYWEPQTVKKKTQNLFRRTVSMSFTIYMNIHELPAHAPFTYRSITWGFIKLYHTKINQSLPFKSIFSLLSVWKSSQSLQSVMERFPRNMLPRSIFGKLIFGSLTLGILNSGIWMFPKSIFGIVMEGIWMLERSNDGRLMFGICILEKSTFGNDIFLKSISGIFIFCRFTEGSLTLGNLIFGNRSFSSKKSKEINESNN